MKSEYPPVTAELIYQHFPANRAKHLLRVSWKDGIDIDEPTSDVVSLLHAYADASREATTPQPNTEQLIEAFVDAASAYEKHASRARHLKPRAVADALFTTRLNDFKQAAARAQAACQKLTVKENK